VFGFVSKLMGDMERQSEPVRSFVFDIGVGFFLFLGRFMAWVKSWWKGEGVGIRPRICRLVGLGLRLGKVVSPEHEAALVLGLGGVELWPEGGVAVKLRPLGLTAEAWLHLVHPLPLVKEEALVMWTLGYDSTCLTILYNEFPVSHVICPFRDVPPRYDGMELGEFRDTHNILFLSRVSSSHDFVEQQDKLLGNFSN
jgi:hypothetical protein